MVVIKTVEMAVDGSSEEKTGPSIETVVVSVGFLVNRDALDALLLFGKLKAGQWSVQSRFHGAVVSEADV